MTISELLLLYFILFSIGSECTRKFHRQVDYNYDPEMSQGQGQVQIETLTVPPREQTGSRIEDTGFPMEETGPPIDEIGLSREPLLVEQEMQPLVDSWARNTVAPPTLLPTTTTTHRRYLPHSYKRTRKTTTTPAPPTTTTTTASPVSARRTHRRNGRVLEDSGDSIADKSRDLINGRDTVIQHISMYLQQYFIRAVVQDFISRMNAAVKANNVHLTNSELAAVENKCVTCTVPELHASLNVLLTVMEKYPELSADKSISGHVATEFDRALDYLTRKLSQLRSEIGGMRYDKDFFDLQRRYIRRERNGGIMSLLLEWYASYISDSQDNVDNIQQKLMKYLTTQKRYWLISIRGVL